jgi:hypothetical protein
LGARPRGGSLESGKGGLAELLEVHGCFWVVWPMQPQNHKLVRTRFFSLLVVGS